MRTSDDENNTPWKAKINLASAPLLIRVGAPLTQKKEIEKAMHNPGHMSVTELQ